MTTAKEKNMRTRMTCLAVAAALAMAGCTEIVLKNDPPVAKIAVTQDGNPVASGQGVESADGSPLTFMLDASGSTDEDGTIVGWRWARSDISSTERLGGMVGADGGVPQSAIELGDARSISSAFGPGTHRVTLWVVDDEGGVSKPASVTLSVTSAQACLALYSNPNPGCADCLCKANVGGGVGGCRDEIMACMANPDPNFAKTCGDLVDCAARTGCSGGPCYGPDICRAELDATTADYGGFPGGCTDYQPGEAPCPTATAIATCRDEQSECAALCPVTMM